MFMRPKEEIGRKESVFYQEKSMSESNESCCRGAEPVIRMSAVSNQSALSQLKGNNYRIIQRMEETDEDKSWRLMRWIRQIPGISSIVSFLFGPGPSPGSINHQVPMEILPMPTEGFGGTAQPSLTDPPREPECYGFHITGRRERAPRG